MKKTLTAAQVKVLRAHQFVKGQSGNPSGRPRGRSLSACYRMALNEPHPDGGTWAMAIARAVVRLAASGDTRAAAELADRVEGKPRAEFSVEAYGEVFTLDSFRGMTDEQLNQRLEQCNRVLRETAGRTQ